ncbi:MAG TPA: 5'/3'-nucleotidase SurE [Thermoanaerobaculales bacterium]|nr:5'/3'-nucleotidase SurE [Thermoanaerobaculales bacterium]HPA81301.1 5'/3'-nucleotidase SurE [Thermoanaerobaculales bacterium]HQN97230.1 5'/3'-nucleotidase SurE [Thermoanaerobaculales bacterium]HQP43676.1 5'/3'-nucleotidase SurE [Thermoanaerobaculales bacterium]
MQRRFWLVFVVGLTIAAAAVAEDAPRPFHVMVTNDDGVDAPGLEALVRALAADGGYRVTVVAPAENQSVASNSHVTRRDVALRPHAPIAGAAAWSVDATPASVARLGLTAVVADDPPDLVVAGINAGENDGLGAWTSGTVAAAREAVASGIPGVAFSLELDWDDPRPDFDGAASWCKPVIDAVRDRGLPPGVYLNVNVPRDIVAIRGYRLARMSVAPPAVARFEQVREEPGVRWFRSRWRPPADAEPGSDSAALHAGWVAIAALGMDQTGYQAIPVLLALDPVEPQPPAVELVAVGAH